MAQPFQKNASGASSEPEDDSALLAELIRRLERAGVELGVRQFAGNWVASAVALRAADCAQLVSRVTDWIEALLLGTRHITLDLRDTVLARDADTLLNLLARYMSERELRERILFQLSAAQACDTSWQQLLGDFQTAVSARLQPTQLARRSARWFCAPPAWVRPTCPALGVERALVCLAGHHALVADGAAPLVVTVHVDRLPAAFAELPTLCQLMIDAVDLAHDLTRWPSARLAADAFRQRRLIVVPVGGGPATAALMETLAPALRAASARAAVSRGVFPAMEADDVLRGLLGRADYAGWRMRWHAQTSAHRYRHRQLLGAPVAEICSHADDVDPYLMARQMLRAGDSVVLGATSARNGSGACVPEWLGPLLDRPELAGAEQ